MKTLQEDLFELSEVGSSLLVGLLDSSDTVLVKKLSNNDRDWARYANKHQAGVYVPPVLRDSEFFPDLERKERPDPTSAEIREVFFSTDWPQFGVYGRKTRLVHYTSKGPETHMTGLPKEAFALLSPASFLVMAKIKQALQSSYICLTIESGSEDAQLLADKLDLGPEFSVGLRRPADFKNREQELILDFIEQAMAAWLAGTISEFAKTTAALPPTAEMAALAQKSFLKQNNVSNLDPFVLERPGDALREISRGIEWDLFREFQKRERAITLVRIIMGDEAKPFDARLVLRSLVEHTSEVDALMLSASQQRKSRAGYSFEHHIERMLIDGRIPHEKQAVIEGKKRPDFILPSLVDLRKKRVGRAPGLILSAKTTLRERWKQVEREMGANELFLATVDENIAGNSIDEMETMGIVLVVPESLKNAKETEYAHKSNVITFKDFFRNNIVARMASWSQARIS
jgi:hypothetical protein